jgi:hypothetical protein
MTKPTSNDGFLLLNLEYGELLSSRRKQPLLISLICFLYVLFSYYYIWLIKKQIHRT